MGGDGIEKSIESPRMGVSSFRAASAVVGDAEAIPVKRSVCAHFDIATETLHTITPHKDWPRHPQQQHRRP